MINAGAPVMTPWRDDVAAILMTYFGGQEYGQAVGDLLSGQREPGGRLPTTWPAAPEDAPILDLTPRHGQLTYGEDGQALGYRGYLAARRTPAYSFGHGLGYTTWRIDHARASRSSPETIEVITHVINSGTRPGKQVIQVYVEGPDSDIPRPPRWLVGHGVVRADPGQAAEVRIPVRPRDLAYWDGEWRLESGPYTFHIGFAVDDPRYRVTLHL